MNSVREFASAVTPRVGDLHRSSFWLRVAAFLAVIAGCYGRFKGLGATPLGVDEFYISRSIDNVMRTGLPEFLCGGYYNRGVTYQYIVAALRYMGMTPEFSGRFLSAVCNLAMLPAAYLLGRTLHSKAAGWMAVIVLALSVWEIEMARFARMYAPFQAIFLWYMLAWLRYIDKGTRGSLIAMIALSFAGVLTWEGGALMGILNLLPPMLRHQQGRMPGGAWKYLAGMLLLFAVLYLFATTDLRTLADVPAYGPEGALAIKRAQAKDTTLHVLAASSLWALLAVVPVALSLLSLRWLWSLRSRWMTAAGLAAALVAALAHWFLVAAAVIAIMLLARLIDWREWLSTEARTYCAALIACAIYWLGFGLLTDAWSDGGGLSRLVDVGRALAGFPNVIDNVARPWGRAMPLLCAALLVALAGLAIAEVRRIRTSPSSPSQLLIACMVMVLAVGTMNADRFETRYLFFLYPVLIVLAIVAAGRLADSLSTSETSAVLAMSALVFAAFIVSEDFRPRHVASIDSEAATFRVGLPPGVVDHYYPHNDVRSAGQWLEEHVGAGDVVMTGVPSLDQYYAHADMVFLDEQDNRYQPYACAAGTVDRWTNKPLLRGSQRLDAQVRGADNVFLVMYPGMVSRLLATNAAQGWRHRVAWSSVDGGVNILVLNPR